MCLIVDASSSHCLVPANNNALGTALLKKFLRGEVKWATGGKNLAELSKLNEVRTLVEQLIRSGDAFRYSNDKLDAETKRVEKNSEVQSNDAHNIALAIVSGAHVLVTGDDALAADFRNSRVVPSRANCRKTVVRDDTHCDNLRRAACCKCLPP